MTSAEQDHTNRIADLALTAGRYRRERDALSEALEAAEARCAGCATCRPTDDETDRKASE